MTLKKWKNDRKLCMDSALKIITHKLKRILKECKTKLHVNPAHHTLNNKWKFFIML